MYITFGSPKDIYDLKKSAGQLEANRVASPVEGNTRKGVDILVIDDQAFPFSEILKRYEFNLRQVEDLVVVKDVERYQVIICDIRGIGRKLDETNEGGAVIQEIRKQYPLKYIIAYSAFTFDPTFNKYWSSCDSIMKKDSDSAQWVDVLDNIITKIYDPIEVWRRIRNYLIGKDVPLQRIVKLEDDYVKSVQKKRKPFQNLGNKSDLSDEIKKVLVEVGSSIVVKLISQRL